MTYQTVDSCDCGCWRYIPTTIPKKDLELEYNGRKYNLVKQKNHPYSDKNDMIPNHRLVMESYLERYLLPDEHVYHVNGLDKDDDLDNLVLKTNYEPHMTKHILRKGSGGQQENE